MPVCITGHTNVETMANNDDWNQDNKDEARAAINLKGVVKGRIDKTIMDQCYDDP